MIPGDEIDGDLGRLDVIAMDEIRSAFTGLDGLIRAAGFETPADPETVHVYLADGIGAATECRFDIRWYDRGYYAFHHTDSTGRNFRWDYHPKMDAPDRHFHPPPDARSTDPEPSCLTLQQPPVVARVVHRLWRRAYDTGNTNLINSPTGGL